MADHWYNQVAREIWRTHSSNRFPWLRLAPIQRPALELRPHLLMVGMNPSFAREDNDGLSASFFEWPSNHRPSSMRIQAWIAHEEQARTEYRSYYEPHRRFAQSVCAGTYDFLDVLPMRHTNQAEIVDALWAKEQPSAFARACLELFQYSLARTNPRVVLIANAGASRRVRDHLGLIPLDAGGAYVWRELPETMFFLSGTLTGRRALDEFSVDRIARDIFVALHEPR